MNPKKRKEALKTKKDWTDPYDSTPVEVPANLKRAETQDERVRRIIREQIRPESYGYETEEDNEDLDIEDDSGFLGELPLTPAEMEYLKSSHGDLIDEILEPLGSPKPAVADEGEQNSSPESAERIEKDEGRNSQAADRTD